MSFVTFGTVQVTLYLRAYTNVLLYFPQSVPDLGEMRCHISVYDAPRRFCEFVKIDPDWAVIFLLNFQLRVSRKTFRDEHKEHFGRTCVPRHRTPLQSCRGTETLITVILKVRRLILSWALWPHPTSAHCSFNIRFSIILLYVYFYGCFQVLRVHVNMPYYLRHECFMSGQFRWSWFGQVCRELRNVSSQQLIFPRSSCMNRMTNSKSVLVPTLRLTPETVLLRQDSGFTLNQEILRTVWSPTFYCRVYMSPLLVPVSTHINLAHALPSHFFKIHFKIILLRSQKLSLWRD